ncbi:MAG: TonB-dependent receptor [Tannerella sp.]|jgi:TonB-linked SusC/RagA family outer membrane protein|nr:TonB-dependent receptor [Tannerella sp.]
MATSQNVSVSGTIMSAADGLPVIGASVFVKGNTSVGTITDIDGKYSLDVPSTESILTFSYVGYVTKEIKVSTQRVINVTLEEDSKALDEVIVVGYGTMRKSDLTGAVARVNLEDKETLANVSLAQALSGVSPGISIQPTGRAGEDPVLNIRGQNSFTGSQDPLIVLDGVIYYGSISDINVNDVESIDMLKDASAASVYGSRSANGVILITTKKGKEGKPRVSFDMYYGGQWMTNNPMRVMNGDEYARRMADYYYQETLYSWYGQGPTGATDKGGKPAPPNYADKEFVASRLVRQEERENYLAGREVDWVEKVLNQPATIENYNISYSGKTDRLDYFASASYTREDGVMKFDWFNRYTIRVNLNSKITDWLKVGVNTAYTNREYSGKAANMEFARVASPWANDDTMLPPEQRAMYLTAENYMRHPLEREATLTRDIRNNTFFVITGRIDVPWVKGLSYDIKYSSTIYNRENDVFYPAYIHDGLAQNGHAERRPDYENSWLFDHIISYVNSFGDHHVNATLLYSREKRTGRSYDFISERFDNPILGFENMTMGSLIRTANPDAWMQSGVGYMGRLNYTYKDLYMFTGTWRRDGSSTFPAGNKWASMPSVSLAWVLTNESFMQNLPWLYAKLRLSYGVNGNPGAGRYSSLSQISTGYYQWGSEMSLTAYPNVDRMGNANLRWERTSQYNFGIDFGFWNRVNGSIELYSGKTTDVIVQRGLPKAAGFNSIRTNLGELSNKGVEIALNTVNLKDVPLKWRSGIVFSLNRNSITDLYGDGTQADVENGWFIGQSIGAIYDYENNGIWQEEDLYEGRIGPNGSVLQGWYPGQYRKTDINGDRQITGADDRKVIGNREANFRWALSNTLNYKNFGLYFLFNSVMGGNGWFMENNYNNVNVVERSDDVRRVNQSAVRPYWTPENRVNNATGVYNQQLVYGGIYEDRSFIRLQDVSLSYNFDKPTLAKMGGFIEEFQIFVSGRNLYTWTKWSGWDPEIMYLRYSDRSTQNQHNIAMRNVTAGVKLTF